VAQRVFDPKRFAIGLFLLCFAFLGLTSSPATAAPAKSKVVIDKVQTRLYGYVRSDAPRSCSKNRQVVVFKMRKGGGGVEVGHSKTRKFGAKAWQWSLRKKSGPGAYRAVLPAKPGCAQSKSGQIVIGLKGGSYTTCDNPWAYSCWIGLPTSSERLYFFTFPHACPSIGETVGACDGEASRGSEIWGNNHDASILWSHKLGDNFITFAYQANGSSFLAHLPDPGSARLSIVDGHVQNDKTRLCTPDLPGVDAGKPGGPIYMDFENEVRGAEVYFWGVVHAARSATEC